MVKDLKFSFSQRLTLAVVPRLVAVLLRLLHRTLRYEVVVEPGRSYFDTNIDDHHHFFCESTGMLQDIPGTAVRVGALPSAPAGTEISRVDVIIRVRRPD